MKDKKKIVIGTLCALIMIMAVGYALLSQQLSINGTANITSNWQVEITNITEKERHGGVTEKSKSYDAMTANFDVGFTSPGDYIIYDVEVTNSGTLDAVIERINVVTNNNPAIIYTTSGIKRGDVIEHNSKKYLTVKIEYDSSVISQPQTNNNALTVQLFTAQNLGQVQPEYQTYSIGDKITFAGSDWYVINDSSKNEDYVTLMKENVLTNAELGNYAYKTYDTMPYYWDDNCHPPEAYGYSSWANSCENTNSYTTSKVKEFLETTYLTNIGTNKLKAVELDGESYKIRLITLEELQSNLGVSTTMTASWYVPSSLSSLSWVCQGFGEGQNNVYGYWIMKELTESPSTVWQAGGGGRINTRNILNTDMGVRPVINLLKSAIE